MFYSRVYSFLALLICADLTAFEILSQNGKTKTLGFGEWNIALDGEAVLMEKFLKSGDLVFDIGGNHGEWSSFALKIEPAIQIKVFEPAPPVFKSLKESVGSYKNIQLFNCALSDQVGMASFCYYPQADGLSGFYYREVLRGDQPDPLVISVEQTTLDIFCELNSIAKIDFIKIDTEGAEWRILQGARQLIENHQVRSIQFEYGGCYIDAKTTLKDVMLYLTENRYAIFRIIPTGLIHIRRWEPSLENYHLSNYFAICEEDLPGYSLVNFGN